MACYVNPAPTFNLTQHLSLTEFRPAKATVVNTLAGGSVAQPGVIAERWSVDASNCDSAIGEEGSEPSTLLFVMPGLMFDDGRGLALRMSAAVRSLWMLIALAG